jgi:hypothetical protein
MRSLSAHWEIACPSAVSSTAYCDMRVSCDEVQESIPLAIYNCSTRGIGYSLNATRPLAQGVKTVPRRRLVRVSHRVVLGTLEAVQEVLAKHSWQMSPSFVERLQLAFQPQVAAIGRRVNPLCTQAAG